MQCSGVECLIFARSLLPPKLNGPHSLTLHYLVAYKPHESSQPCNHDVLSPAPDSLALPAHQAPTGIRSTGENVNKSSGSKTFPSTRTVVFLMGRYMAPMVGLEKSKLAMPNGQPRKIVQTDHSGFYSTMANPPEPMKNQRLDVYVAHIINTQPNPTCVFGFNNFPHSRPRPPFAHWG